MKKHLLTKTFLFLAFLIWAQVGWGQQVIGTYSDMEGGFEKSSLIDNSTTFTSAQTNKWVKNNASTTITEESVFTRSGSKSLSITNSTTTGRRVWSPLVTVGSTTSNVTIQFFRYVQSTTNTQQSQTGVGNGTTTGESLSGSYTVPSAADTWEKLTYTRSSWTFTNIAGIIMTRQTGTGGILYVDDFVMYNGAVDNTAPNSPGVVTVDNATGNSLDVSWVASDDVDGGGYVVVRFSASPDASYDPNQNGIYAVGNDVSTGGTVRYIGTSTSFTDNDGLSEGTQYWYKVYTVDKAFNYSVESSGTGTTIIPPTITLSGSILTGFNYVEGSGPSTEQSFDIEGSDLTNDISITPPTNYEISITTGGSFVATNPITLTQSGGTVSSTTIYVRLKTGLSEGTYNSENITATSTGAANKTVTCNGTVYKVEPTNYLTGLSSTVNSNSQITLNWTDATGGTVPDGYLILMNLTGTFTDPVDGVAQADGAGVKNIAQGVQTYAWSGLDPGTHYYYKVFPYTNSGTAINYKVDGVVPTTDATTTSTLPEPTNHVTGFAATVNSDTEITLDWTDAVAGAQAPENYLILYNTDNSFADPVDGTAQADAAGVKNIAYGVETYQFTGLTPGLTYYFQIYPYTNSGTAIDYKTTATVPAASGQTPKLQLTLPNGTEVLDGGSSYNVTWSSAVISSNIKIELTTNGTDWVDWLQPLLPMVIRVLHCQMMCIAQIVKSV